MLILCLSDGEGKTSMMLDRGVVATARELKVDYLVFPESGLHPNKHADITENLVKKGGDVMVATHSEIVVLRALRMIREGRLNVKDFDLTQYLQRDDGTYYWHTVEINREGELVGKFVGGFFETGFNERY